MDDPRNMLVFHFARIVAELEAPYFIFENVKGLTLGKHRKFLDEVIHEFESNGYEVLLPYKVLNAAQFGVPQERYRLFLIGARKGLQLPSYPQPTTRPAGSDTDGLYFPQGPSVWDAIGDLPKVEKYPELFERDFTYAVFKKPSEYARALRGLERSASDFGYPRINDTGLLTSSRRTFHNELSRKRFAETDFGRTEPVSRFHKLDPKGVCNTIRAGTASDRGAFTSPRPIHPFVERCITVREAARLHSYPDWFRFHTTKWHGFRQIGNSVPPLLARSVAAKLIDCIEDRRQVPRKPIPLGDPSLLTLSMSEAAARYNVSKTVIAQRIRTAETKRKREKQGVRIA
jgi:DNA (cytosine-5)-methyltransferase 1